MNESSNVIDSQGKTVHYSGKWEPVTFTNGFYSPKKSFRLYVENEVTLILRGNKMSRKEAVAITLTEGYHNFVCVEIIENGSDTPNGVFALF